jgi:hypothetical protein
MARQAVQRKEYCPSHRGMVEVEPTGDDLTCVCALCGAQTVEPSESSTRRHSQPVAYAVAWQGIPQARLSVGGGR